MVSIEAYSVRPQVAVLDNGGQYANLVKKRVQNLGVRAVRVPGNIKASELTKYGFKAIIGSGGPRNF